jgi:D-xylose transport system permease protein
MSEELLPVSPRTTASRPFAGLNSRFRARQGLRSLGLIGVVVVIWLILQYLTNGLFLSPRNITNLTVQVAITAILAAGIVPLMVGGHIDLSIGAAVAFTAIIAAVVREDFGFTVPMAIAAALVIGLAIGAWQGAWVAWSGVPAFIVTLASLLALRGAALLITGGATRSPGRDMTFIASAFVPAEVTALIFGGLWLGFLLLLLRDRSARLSAGMSSPFTTSIAAPAALVGVVAVGGTVVAVSYRGMPLPVAILLATVAVIWFIMRFTRFGRHLHAMGGNPEAARYAGISIARHTFAVFLGMGLLYGVAGLILLARLNTAPPNAAIGLELQVIAAAVIGGTSLLGGVGTVAGAVIGALLMESLNNGMSLMNLPSYWQQITVGGVLLLAVFFDLRGRRGT